MMRTETNVKYGIREEIGSSGSASVEPLGPLRFPSICKYPYRRPQSLSDVNPRYQDFRTVGFLYVVEEISNSETNIMFRARKTRDLGREISALEARSIAIRSLVEAEEQERKFASELGKETAMFELEEDR